MIVKPLAGSIVYHGNYCECRSCFCLSENDPMHRDSMQDCLCYLDNFLQVSYYRYNCCAESDRYWVMIELVRYRTKVERGK